MIFRLADKNDLPLLKTMYKEIIDNMKRNNIQIWDDVYPCEFFQNDIDCHRLYLLVDDDITAAFALCESNDGEDHLKWNNPKAKALYIDRFGVNVNYSRLGLGGIMLENAISLAKQKNSEYLRLLVVDINKPAINLYLKNGFQQVDGIYEEKIDDFVLREYGFEIEIEK